MASLYEFRQSRMSLWQRSLILTCLLLFLLLTIAGLIILSLIPLYLSDRVSHQPRPSVASPLTVTYLIVNQEDRESANFDIHSVDRQHTARSFENGLGLRIRGVLKINNIASNVAKSSRQLKRRKRFVTCDQDPEGLKGPVLIFDFNLTYPIHRSCQTASCVKRTFTEIYQQFQSVPNLSIDFSNVTRDLRLCSFNVKPYEEFLTTNATSTASTTTSGSSLNSSMPSSTVTSQSSPSTSPSTSSLSSSSSDSSTSVNSRTSTATSTSFDTSATSSATETTALNGLNTTTSGDGLPSDTETDLLTCLRNMPFTQESVPPYRITHTSTLFARDDPTLIIVGAAKVESNVFFQSLQREIMINGITVYRHCQRTIELSVPIVRSINM